MNTDNERAAMFATDVTFTKALRKQFPNLRHLGDVRYDRARHNAETLAAGDAYRRAVDAFHGSAERLRRIRAAIERDADSADEEELAAAASILTNGQR